VQEEALKPSSPKNTIGGVLDQQVVNNHFRNGVHVVEQSYSRWSFGELKRHVEAFANGLLALQFRAGDKLALALPNNAEMLVAMLGAAKIGVTVVPLSETPSEQLLKDTLSSGVMGLVFTDVVDGTNYADMLSKMVPEVDLYGEAETHGLPFQSATFPELKYLINTAKARVDGMLRYSWVPVYAFDDTLQRATRKLSDTTPFLLNPATNKAASHGELLSSATKVLAGVSLPENARFALGAPVTTASAFSAGYLAAHMSGSLCAWSQANDAQAFDMMLRVIKPNVFVADQKALEVLADMSPTAELSHLVLVGECDKAAVDKASSALGSKSVVQA